MRKSNEKSAVTATTGGKKNHLAAKIYKYRGFYQIVFDNSSSCYCFYLFK